MSEQVAAKFVKASGGKCGQANTRCDWSRKVLHAWAENDVKVENNDRKFVLVNVDKAVFTANPGCDFDRR